MLNSKKHNRDAGRIGETEIPVSDQETINQTSRRNKAHLQSSVFKLSKDLIDSIHEEGIVAYTS